jgi:hypothetical protein
LNEKYYKAFTSIENGRELNEKAVWKTVMIENLLIAIGLSLILSLLSFGDKNYFKVLFAIFAFILVVRWVWSPFTVGKRIKGNKQYNEFIDKVKTDLLRLGYQLIDNCGESLTTGDPLSIAIDINGQRFMVINEYTLKKEFEFALSKCSRVYIKSDQRQIDQQDIKNRVDNISGGAISTTAGNFQKSRAATNSKVFSIEPENGDQYAMLVGGNPRAELIVETFNEMRKGAQAQLD